MDHLAQDTVGGHGLTRRLTCHDTAPLLADPPRRQSAGYRCDRGMWRERGEASSLLGRGWEECVYCYAPRLELGWVGGTVCVFTG